MDPVDPVRTPLRVLLVEDEPLVSMMIEYAMTERGFKVHAVANGDDALRLLAGGSPIDVMFTDINLAGGMTGAQLAWRARELRPGLPVIYASGRTSGIDDAVPGSAFIAKPYLPSQVCDMLVCMVDNLDSDQRQQHRTA
jgi:CheY-like chemotaxis protein